MRSVALPGSNRNLLRRLVLGTLLLLALFLSPGLSVHSALDVGLIAHWSFDEGSGTTANDSSGNGNTGTLVNGPAWVDGKLGRALDFSGSNNYVLIPHNDLIDFAANEDFSISFWFKDSTKSGSDNASGHELMEKQDSDGVFYQIRSPSKNGSLRFQVDDGVDQDRFNSSVGDLADGLWHHVVFIREYDTSITAYVDGVFAGSDSTVSAGSIANTVDLRLGRGTATGDYDGLLDEVRFYNRALTPQEVVDLFNAENDATTVVFQEGAGGYVGTIDTYIVEGSPNTNHGILGSVEWDGDYPQGSGQEKIALVRFGSIFGRGLGQVPLGATISSATLAYSVDNDGDPSDIHEVLSDWSEGVTYNDFGGDPGVQPDEYGDLVETASAFVSIGVHSVDVTASVSAWANAPSQNRGWIFLPTGPNAVKFRSSEHSIIAERPRLEVVFMPAPRAPTAVDDGPYTLTEDTTLTVAVPGVLGNDSDPDGDPLTAVLATSPTNGTLTLNPDGSFSYTPVADFNGTDTLTYRADDGTNFSNQATVTIDVTPINDDPVAVDDRAFTLPDTPVGIDVLLNDFDVDGDALSVASTGPTAAGGTVVIEVDNTVTYTPPPGGFTGTDSFTYAATDGALSSGVATVTVFVTTTPTPPPGFKVAFIGDQSVLPSAKAVLQLIRDEGADMVLHQGDLGYRETNPDSPLKWESLVNTVLGPDFPLFASIGNHDLRQWSTYEQLLVDRLARVEGASCSGVYGVNAACTYRGMFFILSGPGTLGTAHETFIRDQLAQDNSIWRICSWHKIQKAMQVGSTHGDEVGWAPYEECRKGRAIIATAHEHSYQRTKTLSDMQSQTVDPMSPDPDLLRVDHGSTFVFVSGLGGRSIRSQGRCLPTTPPYGCNGEWASIYTSDQGADYGALFIEFNVDGDARKARGYFKNIDGVIVDSFTITSGDVNDAPRITSAPVATGIQDFLYSYDVEAADPDVGDTLTFLLDVSPAGMTIDGATGLITWTPDSSQVGDNDVTVRVTDAGLLFDTQAFVVTVANVNDPPQISSTPVATTAQDLLYSYDVEATDPDVGDTLTFSLDVSPAGMAMDGTTGLITWTPDSSQVGDNDVTVRVTDAGLLFDTQSFVVTVATVIAQVCGDLSSDGAVNVFDAIITLQIAVGLVEMTPAQQIVGDLNHDGAINVMDAIMILQHIVGSAEITGCGPP